MKFQILNSIRILLSNNKLKQVLVSKLWIVRSGEAKLLFFCFCNLWLTCFSFSSHYLHRSEVQKQKYSSLYLHPAKISLLSISHHIRILIYTILLWILKSSVPFQIIFKFKAPRHSLFHWWRQPMREAMRHVLTYYYLISLPILSPFSSLKARGIFWCIRCVRNN